MLDLYENLKFLEALLIPYPQKNEEKKTNLILHFRCQKLLKVHLVLEDTVVIKHYLIQW